MAVKVFFLLCVEAVFAQTAYSQCIGNGFPGPGGPLGGLGSGYDGLPCDSFGLSPFEGNGVGTLDSLNFSPFDNPYGPNWPNGFSGLNSFAQGPTFPGSPFDSPYGPNWPNGFSGLNSFAQGPTFPGPVYGSGMPQAYGSSVPPASLSVISENYIEGTVSVVGQLPFVASVSMAGEFPSVGAGAVSYGCGDGDVRIIGEGAIGPSFMPAVPAIDPIDYTGLYSYGPGFVEDYRWPGPYTGPSCGPMI